MVTVLRCFIDFNADNIIKSLNFKAKITDETGANGRKDVDIMVPLRYE